MEVKSIQRHRERSSEDKQERKSNFVRKVSNGISVCKKAFISLHAISHWQVQRLNTLLLAAKCPRDLRGKHNNRPRTICDEWTQKIKEHIEAFPVVLAAIIALLSLIDNFQRQWDVVSAFFVQLAVKKLRQPSTDGLHSHTFKILKEHKQSPPLPNDRAYKEPIPINEKKILDIKKVMCHTLEFYYHITSWKTTNMENDD
ncbi:unnamed protein product [Acanthoscelides obtectus]|uniref:Uncharacterized protein n=1 Tax=Acanthoscelides obtectus TaxID=200917 RepID=A0A9P0M8V4_ACAOB|nr:unnamed protein product [Acanthoscelides obtectus]CAK1670812.1 hypothetical protein AOBTE_LOCUS27846 [Acanthoscelides obtectus]